MNKGWKIPKIRFGSPPWETQCERFSVITAYDWDALRLFDEKWMPLLLPFCDIRVTIPPEVGPD